MFTTHSKNQLLHLANKGRERVADTKVRRKLEFDKSEAKKGRERVADTKVRRKLEFVNSDEEAISNMNLDQLIEVAKKKARLTDLGEKSMYVNAIQSKCLTNLDLDTLQHIATEIGISVKDQREMYLDFINKKTEMKMTAAIEETTIENVDTNDDETDEAKKKKAKKKKAKKGSNVTDEIENVDTKDDETQHPTAETVKGTRVTMDEKEYRLRKLNNDKNKWVLDTLRRKQANNGKGYPFDKLSLVTSEETPPEEATPGEEEETDEAKKKKAKKKKAKKKKAKKGSNVTDEIENVDTKDDETDEDEIENVSMKKWVNVSKRPKEGTNVKIDGLIGQLEYNGTWNKIKESTTTVNGWRNGKVQI